MRFRFATLLCSFAIIATNPILANESVSSGFSSQVVGVGTTPKIEAKSESLSAKSLSSQSLTAQSEEDFDVMPDFFSAPGLDPFRSYVGLTDAEYIDPFSGSLSFNHTDLVVPGNGGMDIVINRWYSSPNGLLPQRTVAGAGWHLHMGRISISNRGNLCSAYGNSFATFNPVMEMPGGSAEKLFRFNLQLNETTHDSPDSTEQDPYRPLYITKSYSKGECIRDGNDNPIGLKVTDTNGTVYTFDYFAGDGNVKLYYITRKEDVHGNWLSYSYAQNPVGIAHLDQITSSDGRTVDFEYLDVDTDQIRLDRITYGAKEWIYETARVQESASGTLNPNNYYLKKVITPEPNFYWEYDYQKPYVLDPEGAGYYAIERVRHPHGAVVEYDYKLHRFQAIVGSPQYHVIKEKRLLSTANMPAATWTYDYSFDENEDLTVITGPEGIREYHHYGITELWGKSKAFLGLLKKLVQKKPDGSVLQEVTNDWGPNGSGRGISTQYTLLSNTGAIGDNTYDAGVLVPILRNKTVKNYEQNGTTIRSTQYDSDLWYRFGDPAEIKETSNDGVVRTTRHTYFSDPGKKWIVKRLEDERVVSVNIGDQLTDSLTDRTFYDGNCGGSCPQASYGDLISTSVDGVITTMGYHPSGDLKTLTNANFKTTTYLDYYRGVPREEQHPEGVNVTRVVNPVGTIASETNGEGKTTQFLYDGLNRVSKITLARPLSFPTFINWITPNQRELSRGDFKKTDTLDGFGRVIQSAFSRPGKVIYQKSIYNDRGQVTFKSYPNDTTDLSKGATTQYDYLNRVELVTFQDGTSVSTDYFANNRVVVTDEEQNQTEYLYRSFADGGKFLIRVNAPENISSETQVNVLGQTLSIMQGTKADVDSKVALKREYKYNTKFQLAKKYEPEIGWTEYKYDFVGNLKSEQDIGIDSDIVIYDYDGLNRLDKKHFYSVVGSTPNELRETIDFDYDKNSNLKSLSTLSGVVRTYGYDDNDSLDWEQLSVDGKTFYVDYAYDDFDFPSSIQYPSGLVVDYAPNSFGQPTKAGDFVSQVDYYPSGITQAIYHTNGWVDRNSLDERKRLDRAWTDGSGLLLDYDYAYYGNGNLKSVIDGVNADWSLDNLTYDGVNRLRTVSSKWGTSVQKTHVINYDALGNISTKEALDRSLSYNYDPDTNRLASISGTSSADFSYDAHGNVTQNGYFSYDYDGKRRLGQVRVGSTVRSRYEYDGSGIRVKSEKDGTIAYHLYSNGGQYLGEYRQDGSPGKENIYLGSRIVAYVEQTGVPEADAGGPYYVESGNPFSLDGSKSKDPESGTLTYQWNFSDGGSATGVSPSYTFSAIGTYTASLIVSNGQDSSLADVATIYVDVATVDDALNTGANMPVTFDPVANDPSAQTEGYGLIGVSQPEHGSASILNGQVTYTPSACFVGQDSFSYALGDSNYGNLQTIFDAYYDTVEEKIDYGNRVFFGTDGTEIYEQIKDGKAYYDTDRFVRWRGKDGFLSIKMVNPSPYESGELDNVECGFFEDPSSLGVSAVKWSCREITGGGTSTVVGEGESKIASFVSVLTYFGKADGQWFESEIRPPRYVMEPNASANEFDVYGANLDGDDISVAISSRKNNGAWSQRPAHTLHYSRNAEGLTLNRVLPISWPAEYDGSEFQVWRTKFSGERLAMSAVGVSDSTRIYSKLLVFRNAGNQWVFEQELELNDSNSDVKDFALGDNLIVTIDREEITNVTVIDVVEQVLAYRLNNGIWEKIDQPLKSANVQFGYGNPPIYGGTGDLGFSLSEIANNRILVSHVQNAPAGSMSGETFDIFRFDGSRVHKEFTKEIDFTSLYPSANDTVAGDISFKWFDGDELFLTFRPHYSQIQNDGLPVKFLSIPVHSVFATATIDVSSSANSTPSAYAGEDRSIWETETIALDGVACVASNRTITEVSWRQINGPTMTLVGANTQNANFVAPDARDFTGDPNLVFEFSVTDSSGMTSTDQVSLTFLLRDLDQDGVSDYWEQYYFGGAVWSVDDADQDGYNNLYEYYARTDPTVPNQGDVSWGDSQLISNLGDAIPPRIESNGAGRSVVAWVENGQAKALIIDPATGIGSPVALEGTGYQSSSLDVDMNANGQAIVVWKRGSGTSAVLASAFYNPSTGWAAAKTGVTGNFVNPDVVLDPNGKAIAIWEHVAATFGLDYLRYGTFTNGAWSGATQINANYVQVGEGSIAMNESGLAVITWTEIASGNASVKARTYNGSLGAVSTISTGTSIKVLPHVDVNANGVAHVVWQQENGIQNEFGVSNTDLWVNRLESGTWNGATKIASGNGGILQRPRVSTNASGDALFTWHRVNGTSGAEAVGKYSGWYAWYRASSGYQNAATFNTNGAFSVVAPTPSLENDGSAFVAWTEAMGGYDPIPAWETPPALSRTFALKYDPASGWAATTPIQDPDFESQVVSYFGDIAGDGTGKANVVWSELVNSEYLIKVSSYDKAEPVISIDAGPNQTITAAGEVLISFSSTILSGSPTSYYWRQVTSYDASNTGGFDPNYSVSVWPPQNEARKYVFTVRVEDAQGNFATDTVEVTILPESSVNTDPTADAGPSQNAEVGTTVQLDGAASTDVDGTIASYAWTQISGPEVILQNASSVTASFTVPELLGNTLAEFRLIVTDNEGGTATDTTKVIFVLPNQPPSASAGSDRTVSENTQVTLDASQSFDTDGNIVNYQWIQTFGPSVALSSQSSALATLTAPEVSEITLLTFSVTVTDDDGASHADSVSITVSPTNQPPVVKAGSDQNVVELTTVTLDGSLSSDNDGSIVDFLWVQTSGASVSINNSTTSVASFTAPDVALPTTLTFQLFVTDNQGATGSDTVSITVSEEVLNSPPSVDSLDLLINGTAVTLSGSASDPDSNLSAVELSIDSSAWIAATGTSNWTYTITLSQGTHTVKARAIDAENVLSQETGLKTFQIAGEPQIQNCVGDTNPNHVSAGRAYSQQSGFWFSVTTTFYAQGTNDNLGTSTNTNVYLLEQSNGVWTKVTNCQPQGVPPSVSNVQAAAVDQTVTITGSATDSDGQVIRVEVEFDNNDTWLTADSTTSWSYTTSNLSLGNHTVKARAIDNEGYVSSESAATSFELVLSGDAPTVDSVSASVNNGVVAVSGTASDPDGDLNYIEVRFENGGAWTLATGTANWAVSKSDLPVGNYTPEARAVDSQGRISAIVSANVVTIEGVSPTLNTISAAVSGTSVTVTGTASDADNDLTSVQVELDGSGSWVTASGTGNWSATFSNLSEGVHEVRARASDSMSHVSATSNPAAFTIVDPGVAPQVTSCTAAVNGYQATISGAATDADGNLDRVEVSVDGGAWSVATGTSNWQLNTGTLLVGTHSAAVRAFDAKNNLSAVCQTGNFIVSGVAPTINSISAAVSGQDVTVSGTASDADGDLSVVEVEFDSSGSWIPTTGTSSWNYTNSSLAAGNYTVRARAKDSQGNISLLSSSASFEITSTVGQCFTSSNNNHTTAGRAYACGTFNLYRCATGSGQDLGASWSSTSVQEQPGGSNYWVKVPSCP